MRLMKTLRSSVALSALTAALIVGAGTSGFTNLSMAAMAQEASGGSDGGKGNQGGQGSGEQGSQAGQGNQGGSGSGQGGPDATSDGKGPQAGNPSDTNSGGGKPAWAQEGIPEVELGRLSVARSPDQVLDRSLAEALATWNEELNAFYSLPTIEAMVETLSLNWDTTTVYDSPLQSLALMKDILADNASQLPVATSNDVLLAAFLGVASDKTVPISTDTVIAVTTILGYPITGAAATDLAADAEAIRIAVLAGHG